MKIEQLTEELIPLVTRGGSRQLVDATIALYHDALDWDAVTYVRYDDGWLQTLRVPNHLLKDPVFMERVVSDEYWNQKEGNLLDPVSSSMSSLNALKLKRMMEGM